MHLVIYDLNVKIIKQLSLEPNTRLLSIDITSFRNGLYIVRLSQAEQAFHGKLLIQK